MRHNVLYTGVCVAGLENDVLHKYQVYTAAHTIGGARNLGARFIAHGRARETWGLVSPPPYIWHVPCGRLLAMELSGHTLYRYERGTRQRALHAHVCGWLVRCRCAAVHSLYGIMRARVSRVINRWV